MFHKILALGLFVVTLVTLSLVGNRLYRSPERVDVHINLGEVITTLRTRDLDDTQAEIMLRRFASVLAQHPQANSFLMQWQSIPDCGTGWENRVAISNIAYDRRAGTLRIESGGRSNFALVTDSKIRAWTGNRERVAALTPHGCVLTDGTTKPQ